MHTSLHASLSFSLNYFGLAALAASALAVFLIAEGLHRRRARGAKVFSALMASVFVYCFGTAFEFMGRDLGTVLLCTHFEYFGISLLPTMIILTALDFCGLWPRDRTALLATLFALSAVTLGMQLSTETHRLYYIDPVLRSDGPIPILVFGKGPFYLGYQMYLIASLLVLVVLVLRKAIISSGSLRAQALLMLSSFAFPIFGFAAYAGRLFPWGIDLTPLSFPLMGLVISFGLFRFRLFDLEPIALQAVFRTMREGCVIVDAKDRLIDFNDSAKAILPRLPDALVGIDSAVVFSDRPKLLDFIRGNTDDSLEILVGEGEDLEMLRHRQIAHPGPWRQSRRKDDRDQRHEQAIPSRPASEGARHEGLADGSLQSKVLPRSRRPLRRSGSPERSFDILRHARYRPFQARQRRPWPPRRR